MAHSVSFRSGRAAALALTLSVAALGLAACASDDQAVGTRDITVGSVEGYGGFAGRVGTPTTVAVTVPPLVASGSVEGYGGLYGRVGPGVNGTEGFAENPQPQTK